MSARSQSLSERIRHEIGARGPMRFSRFMELALYDPREGYYSSGRAAIGCKGDFFTSVSVGPVLGIMLAGQFLEMWEALDRPADFRLIEQGANDGSLSRDVLAALKDTPLEKVPLTLIEPFEVLKKKQAVTLAGYDVQWVDRAEDLKEFQGVHFSNELFDALPVDLFEAKAGAWHELLVESVNDTLIFHRSENPTTDHDFPLRPDGFRAEIRRDQRELLAAISQYMHRGYLLAIDYGMSREELLAPHRSGGTLACYSQHHRDENPLQNPGDKDITAHVDFTALARDAELSGFRLSGYTDQHHFLVGAATGMLQSLDGCPPTPSSRKLLRSLRTLLHPETMGTQFKCILFEKGEPQSKKLNGFQHSKDRAFLIESKSMERCN